VLKLPQKELSHIKEFLSQLRLLANCVGENHNPVVPWKGVKTADKYGAAAMQITWDPQSFYGKEWRASGSVPFNEDCLYLNIWTPAAGDKNKKLPVAIWIHGGGYREGFAFEPEMDGGEDWASRGVIFVSVTYRLGVIGFFSHPTFIG
jgi:para-nitrobenzyl esterase